MNSVEPKQVRQEIDELLTSMRLERLETVSAHIFQLFGREWKEVTDHNIFVHVFHDSLDDVNKILARDHFKIVFDFVPLSASFAFTCLSKKFVRLSLNKFDKAAPTYGFGFSNPHEKDVFCIQLDRIRNYAKSTLTPTFRMTSLEMESLSIRSPSCTPPRPNLYSDTSRRDYHNPPTPAYSSQQAFPPPFECPPSPYRHQPRMWDSYPRPPFYNHPPPVPQFMNSYDNPYQNSNVSYDNSFREDRMPLPKCDAPDLSKPLGNEGIVNGSRQPKRIKLPLPNLPATSVSHGFSPRPFVKLSDSSERPASVCSRKNAVEIATPPEDKVAVAERRVRALMDSIKPIGTFWDCPVDISENRRNSRASSRASNRLENPAGVIGSPVKGKGGAPTSRHQTPKATWQWL